MPKKADLSVHNDPTARRPKGDFPARNKLTPAQREAKRRADIAAGMSPAEAYKRALVREEGSPDRRKEASTARKRRSLVGQVKASGRTRKPGEVQRRGRQTLAESRRTGGVPGTKPVPGRKKTAPAKPTAKKTAPKPTGSGNPRPRPAPKKKLASSGGSGSFKAAFAAARKAGKKEFTWKGKRYAAVTRDEVKNSGAKNLREFLNNRNAKRRAKKK